MKKLILLTNALVLLTIFPSCATKKVVSRCSVDIVHQACYCHDYLVGAGTAQRVGETVKKDLKTCDKLVGFNPSDWVIVHNIIEFNF